MSRLNEFVAIAETIGDDVFGILLGVGTTCNLPCAISPIVVGVIGHMNHIVIGDESLQPLLSGANGEVFLLIPVDDLKVIEAIIGNEPDHQVIDPLALIESGTQLAHIKLDIDGLGDGTARWVVPVHILLIGLQTHDQPKEIGDPYHIQAGHKDMDLLVRGTGEQPVCVMEEVITQYDQNGLIVTFIGNQIEGISVAGIIGVGRPKEPRIAVVTFIDRILHGILPPFPQVTGLSVGPGA